MYRLKIIDILLWVKELIMQNRWSESELRHAVKAYIHMLNLQEKGEEFVKTEEEGKLLSKLPKRESVKHRLSNISSVLIENGYPIVKGYKPLDNVGSQKQRKRILKIFHELKGIDPKSQIPEESPDEERIRKNAAITGNKAEKVFEELKISNIVSKYADGNLGWKEQIPFDRIIITAATPFISNEIESQINEGGIIVAPMIMKNKQVIVKYKKIGNKLESQIYDDVLFVPNLSGTE